MASGKPIGSFYVQLGLNTKDFQKNLRGAERELKQAFGSAAIRTSQMLAASMAVLAGAVAAVGAASVKLYADLERQQVAFTRLMGSASAAKDRLRELQEFASKTPYTFTELVEYEKRLQALGFQASETRGILTTIGDAASGLGMGADGVGRIIKAFGDIRAKGYLQTQEIRQLAEAGIPAFEILAQKLGVTIPQAMDLIESRAVNATTALAAMTQGMNDRFGGMMALQAETMLGMWSTVRDEVENVGRIIGKMITESTGLQNVMRTLRDAAQAFRRDLEDKGFVGAFSNLLGEKAKLAIIATAGAITGALIPAVASLGIAILTAMAPLAPMIIAGAALAATGYAIYRAWDKWGGMVKGFLAGLPEVISAATNIIKAGVEIVASLVIRVFEKVAATIHEKFAASGSSIKQTLAPVFEGLAGAFKTSADYWEKQAGGSMRAAAAAGDFVNQLQAVYEQEKQLAAFTDWVGVENFTGLWQMAGNYIDVARLKVGLLNQTLEETARKLPVTWETMRSNLTGAGQGVSALWKNITGQGANATFAKKIGSSNISAGGSKNTGADEAKRTSDSIMQMWMQQTQSKAAQLDYQYQKELETLNASKENNKNYVRDKQMLDEVFYQRKVELLRATAEEEAKLQVEQAEASAKMLQEAIEHENQLAETKYEAIRAQQDGSALEAQLQADMRAGDMVAYVEHLNQKQAAYRAHLEGNRNLMEVYDQMQREANRTTADYMAEGYRTVYYGLSNALTNVITGAKNAGEAFKELGMQLIQMVVKWQIQRRLAAVMSKSLEAAQMASSTAMAAATAAAWAPAAAMVAAATFGASTASAAAGLTALSTMSRALSVPMLAEGGIVSKPTLAMIGEGGESEAVIPLSKLGQVSGANVQVNVINQTGAPVQATSKQYTDGGKMIVDLFLEGYSRNVSGIQDIVGRR